MLSIRRHSVIKKVKKPYQIADVIDTSVQQQQKTDLHKKHTREKIDTEYFTSMTWGQPYRYYRPVTTRQVESD